MSPPKADSDATRSLLLLIVRGRARASSAQLLGRLGEDARTELAGGCEHACVAHGVKPRRRYGRAQPREERARIEVYREGPIDEPLLERDADEAVGPLGDALLRDRRAEGRT
jgi:hypothetical protein